MPRTFTVTSEHIRFLLFSFSVLHFLVVGSVRWIKLTYVGFRAHVKTASRIVSYRSWWKWVGYTQRRLVMPMPPRIGAFLSQTLLYGRLMESDGLSISAVTRVR